MTRMARSSFARSSRTTSASNTAGGSIATVAITWQQMVLNHVAQSAGFLVVRAAAFHADRFGRRDLDVVDIAAIPERLENTVAEAERQDVLNGFFAEVMIDAVDVDFVEEPCESPRSACGRSRDRARKAFR